MATAIQGQNAPALGLPGKRYDRIFFSTMAALLFASVAIGFAHTYYLAGVIHAPLPSRIIHIHGAVFSLWMILLLVQVGLVSAKKVAIHRKLGVAGFVFAALMVIVAFLAGANLLTRANTFPDADAIFTLSVVPFSNALEFAVLVGFAYGMRRNTPAHKRLILVATAAIVSAAFFRVQVPWLYHNVQNDYFVSYLFFVVLAAYDLYALRKVHRATLSGSVLVIAINQMGLLLGPGEAWHSVARVIQSWGI